MADLLIIGEYKESNPTHLATNQAIEDTLSYLQLDLGYEWISTTAVKKEDLSRASGILISPGSPYLDQEKALFAIQFARENNIPLLGTCGGFQHIILEYAKNVLGFADASHEEENPEALCLFISKLTCSLVGKELEIFIRPGSRATQLYGTDSALEKYYCNFGVNPKFKELFESGDLIITGEDNDSEIRIVELKNHPFFIGTLFIPQLNSSKNHPHPIVKEFLTVIVDNLSSKSKQAANAN